MKYQNYCPLVQTKLIFTITAEMHSEKISLFVRAQEKEGESRLMVPLKGIVRVS